MKSVVIFPATLLSVLCLVSSAAAGGLPIAKVTIDQATTIATRARPGRIIDTELEKGGSGLRYAFDIKNQGIVYEVRVDAMTGAVLENGRGTPD